MDEVAWMYEQDPARMKPIEESHGEFVSPISEELLKEIWEYIQDGNNILFPGSRTLDSNRRLLMYGLVSTRMGNQLRFSNVLCTGPYKVRKLPSGHRRCRVKRSTLISLGRRREFLNRRKCFMP